MREFSFSLAVVIIATSCNNIKTIMANVNDFKHLDKEYIASAEDVGIFLKALNNGTLLNTVGDNTLILSNIVYDRVIEILKIQNKQHKAD